MGIYIDCCTLEDLEFIKASYLYTLTLRTSNGIEQYSIVYIPNEEVRQHYMECAHVRLED